jgi:hypothetical protein
MLKTILTKCSSSVLLEDRDLTLHFPENDFLPKLKTLDSVERIVEALKKDDDALEE